MTKKIISDFDNLKTPNDLLEFMKNNIRYGFVAKNGNKYYKPGTEWDEHWYPECIVQSYEGMLDTLCGTCWDQVELEREWFKRKGYKFETIYIQFETSEPEPNDYPTHTFIVFNENNKWYLFENSFEPNMGIHEFNTIDNAITNAQDKLLEYAINYCKIKPSDGKLIRSWKYNKPKANINVDEYINHVTKTKL